MIEGKDDSELAAQQIVIDRVRHFRKFETPFLMKCVDEITFYNSGEELQSVDYVLDEFRLCLHIFDSYGTQLEFHGNSKDENNTGSEIHIDFPKDRAISQNEFKTIRLEYITENNCINLTNVKITAPLPENASVYVFLEECENYDFSTIHYGVLDENYDEVKDAHLTVSKGDSFLNVSSKATEINNSTLHIIFNHKITKTLSAWIKMGLIFGSASALSIWPSYHFNPSNAMGITTYVGFAISFLFIIKGWLFSKNMDKKLISYDLYYRLLIWILFFEIAGVILHYNFIFCK